MEKSESRVPTTFEHGNAVYALRTALPGQNTQALFARRFGLTLSAVRDWEQLRRRPDRSSQLLLGMIAADPVSVETLVQAAQARALGVPNPPRARNCILMARRGNGEGHGGPAAGPGWGGPAKGAAPARKGPAPPFSVGNQAAAGPHNLTRAEKARNILDMLYEIAMDSDGAPIARIRAGEAFLNREEGLPIARTVSLNKDDLSKLSDAELEAELQTLEQLEILSARAARH